MFKDPIRPLALLRDLIRFSKNPWIGSKLAKIQLNKLFFDILHRDYRNGYGGKILQLSIRITDQCNLRCETCGQWGNLGFLRNSPKSDSKKDEPSIEQYKETLKDITTQDNFPIVYFWGGEPMLYPGTAELIEFCAEIRLPASIATNGTGIKSAAEQFVKTPLFLLQISIDGHNAELHNKIRPSAGSHDNFSVVEEALSEINEKRRILNSDFPFIASLTTISKYNADYLTNIYETFKDRVDIFIFYLSWWIDETHAETHENDFKNRFGFAPKLHRGWFADWKPEDCSGLWRQICELRRISNSIRSPQIIFIPSVYGEENLKNYYTDHSCCFGYNRCISIFNSAEINCNGDMSPCRDYHDYVVGNIKENTVMELWNSPSYVEFRKNISNKGLMPVCSRCCGLMGY